MPITERQQFVIRQSLPPTAALLGTAVARLYWCACDSGSRTSGGLGKRRTGASWKCAGVAGAVGVVHYLSTGVLVLRMWELDGMQVVFEFEACVPEPIGGVIPARVARVYPTCGTCPADPPPPRPPFPLPAAGTRAWSIVASSRCSTASRPRTT